MTKAVQTLNYSGATATNLFAVMQQTAKRNKGWRKNMADDTAAGHKLSSNVLQLWYKEPPRFTAGTVFGVGNGVLNAGVRNKVMR